MSDANKPTEPTPATPAQPEERKYRRPRGLGKVPSLEKQQQYGAEQGGPTQLDDDIERQLAEAMGGLSEKDLLGAPEPRRKSLPGTAPGPRKGKVVRVHGQDVFILAGGRSEGVMPINQFPEGPPKIGDEVEFSIEGVVDGMPLLSRKGAAVTADWSSVAEGMVVEARVTGTNKGGLEVEVNGIRGFMPLSQIDLYRVEQPEQFVNQRLKCLVTDVDREERNLVVSRRALLQKERDEIRDQMWADLHEGQVREGVVRNIREFGAFVDLGGVDGLIPIGELSWNRVQKVEDILHLGQRVRVVVLRVDRDARKLSLGLKQLTASPWDNVAANYPPGTVVRGKVSRIADFGAFVELEPAVEGLIHISELAPQRVYRVRDIVKEGEEVAVKILSVEVDKRRLSLSLKQAQAAPPPVEEPEEEEEAPAEPVKPRIRKTPLRGGMGGGPPQIG